MLGGVGVARWWLFPLFLGVASLGWWGFERGVGVWGGALGLAWVLVYYGVFWGGWVGVPVLGVVALLSASFLPRRWWLWARWWFGAWVLAWLGVLASLLWLGAPSGFMGPT